MLASAPKEVGDVDIVGKRSGKSDDSNEALARLDLTKGAGDDALDDGSSIFVKKMDLVDDEQLDFLRAEVDSGQLGAPLPSLFSDSHPPHRHHLLLLPSS